VDAWLARRDDGGQCRRSRVDRGRGGRGAGAEGAGGATEQVFEEIGSSLSMGQFSRGPQGLAKQNSIPRSSSIRIHVHVYTRGYVNAYARPRGGVPLPASRKVHTSPGLIQAKASGRPVGVQGVDPGWTRVDLHWRKLGFLGSGGWRALRRGQMTRARLFNDHAIRFQTTQNELTHSDARLLGSFAYVSHDLSR